MTDGSTRRTWPGCSLLAEAAGDPSEGTAPPAQQWLLLEHPGPWARIALASPGFDPASVAVLGDWAETERARIVLVRRPGRAGQVTGPRRWFRVDSRPGREGIRTGTWDTGTGAACAVTEPGDPYDGRLALVCAHGKHDPCCAVRGRPLAASLAAADPEGTWECTHIGGCRFAPALVLLPHGFTYGEVGDDVGAGIVRDYAGDVVRPELLRGRSCLAPAVQAAQVFARSATGTLGVDGLQVTGSASSDTTGEHLWQVGFTGPDCTTTIRERYVEVDRPLTCAGRPHGRMRIFDDLGTV
ncbi:sucrase ferredoxin [Pseudonocardia phyllosphaerae]|uniref:sucrase ferredoxin n=1 Tax=Pseudonocardia phyllosphaerae TaxID=3390502 RepID=UPI00397CD84C